MKRLTNLRWSGVLICSLLLSQGGLAAGLGATQQVAPAAVVPAGLTDSDWTNIRAAYQTKRHEIAPIAAGYRAHNPEQHWRTEFDERGFMTRPDAGSWQWGLELKSYGFWGKQCAIRAGSEMKAEGDRLTYVRDAHLHEWLVNDRRGLEHGFTLELAPG